MAARIPSLDVVIVTWNHNGALARCLAALAASRRTAFAVRRVVVVDNASSPAFDGQLPQHLPMTVIANATNRGFAAACNQGAAGSQADYLLFLNPDTEVGSGSIEAAVGHLERADADRIAIVGLPLEDADGVRQATCGRRLSAGRIFAQTSGLALVAPRRFGGTRLADRDHRDTRRVEFVSGACLVARRAVFEDLGGFDERLTVYLEDADLSLRAGRRGWQTWFVDGEPVRHVGGWTTGGHRALRLAHAWRSLLVYGWMHLGRAEAAAVTGTVLVVAPLARLGQAIVHRSPREVLDACGGYLTLWGLMARDVVSPRP